MTSILILKTGALGDVLRTTSILPGLHERYRDCQVTWVTAPAAADLVRYHPLVTKVEVVDWKDHVACAALETDLGVQRWDRILSFDDEEPLCRLASALPSKRISGAYLKDSGERAYTPDVGPWFDMGLLSIHGKEAADRMKVENRRSHPEIFAEMLGITMGRPNLPLPAGSLDFGENFFRSEGLSDYGAVVGFNTGSGGRWRSKALPIDRTADLAHHLHEALEGNVCFLVLGGPEEAERNARLISEMSEEVRCVDAGTDNTLLDFAAIVSRCDLLLTSDSLALHIGVARNVPVVSFFAPTSAAEIELYGNGAKIESTAPDYCSYRKDADTSTLTVDRLLPACLRFLGRRSS